MNKKTSSQSELNQSHYFEENTLSFFDILIALARQLKVIIITPTILCILIIIYVFFIARPIYTSTAKIMSSTSGRGVSQAAGLAAQFGINIPNAETEPKWVYSEIVKSRTLARAVLRRKFDTDEFGQQKTLLQILTYGNGELKLGLDTLEIIAVNKFREMLKVSDDVKTSVLTLRINAFEPRLAAEINKALIEELDTHQKKYNKAQASETKIFIEERIKDTEKELINAEEDLKVFMDRNRRIQNSPALQLEQQRLTREVTVLTGVFTTLKQQLETTKIEEVKESDYVVVVDTPEVPLDPSKPDKLLSIIMAGLIGIVLGVLIGFFKEASENDEDKEKILKAKLLFSNNISDLFPERLKKIFRTS